MPCVGDPEGAYLTRQMKKLDHASGGCGVLPFVLQEKQQQQPPPQTRNGERGQEQRRPPHQQRSSSRSNNNNSKSRSRAFGLPRANLLGVWRKLQLESSLYVRSLARRLCVCSCGCVVVCGLHMHLFSSLVIATMINLSTIALVCLRYVDLLYGARAWEVLLSRWHSLPPQLSGWHYQMTSASDGSSDSNGNGNNTADDSSQEAPSPSTTTTPSPLPPTRKYGGGGEQVDWVGVQIMYLHTGGLEGTSSQLNRYKHAGLVESHEAM